MIICILHDAFELKKGHTNMIVLFKRVNIQNQTSQRRRAPVMGSKESK